MFNINNKNLISFGIALFAVIALNILVLLPTNVKANVCNNWIEDGKSYSSCNNTSYVNTGNDNNNITNPIPYITSTNPVSARMNTSVIVTVSGHDFVQGSVVKFNDSDRPTTFVNSSTLKAQLSYSDLSNKGDYLITVLNPIPGGGLSNAVLFSVTDYVAPIQASTVKNTTKNTTTTNTTNKTITSTESTDKLNQASDQAAGAIFGANAFMPSSLLQWFFFAILILLAIVLWRKLYVTESTPLKHA